MTFKFFSTAGNVIDRKAKIVTPELSRAGTCTHAKAYLS